MELGDKDLVCLLIFMLLVSISVLLWVGPLLFEPKTDYIIYLEEYQDERGVTICSESVDTWLFMCKEDMSIGGSLYNMTQKQFDELKTECPTGKLISWSYCIGQDINIS